MVFTKTKIMLDDKQRGLVDHLKLWDIRSDQKPIDVKSSRLL
jgi:hypothetical protein